MISKLTDYLKHKIEYLIILLIWIFFGLNNYIWLKKNQALYMSDEAFHLTGALEILDTSKNIPQMILKLLYFSIDKFYPPFFHMIMAGSNFILGRSQIYSVLANLLFMLVMILAIYYTGKKICNKKAGILSVFILSAYPHIFGLSRSPLPDFALTAMLALSLCFLVYTEYFSKTTYSVLFSLSFGFGMLTKQVFILFILPFILLYLVYFIKDKVNVNKKSITNLLIILILILVISGPWYIINLITIGPEYLRAAYFFPKDEYSVFTFTSLAYNYVNLINDQMLMFYFEVFVIGLISWLIYSNDFNKKYLSLFSFSITGVYIIFLLIQRKVPKTTDPYLVYFALISGIGISLLKSKAIRNTIIFLIVCYGLTEYYVLSYKNVSNNDIVMGIRIENLLLNYFYPRHPWSVYYPLKMNPKIDNIIELINKDNIKDKIPNIGTFNPFYDIDKRKLSYMIKNDYGLRYYFKLKKIPCAIVNIAQVGTNSKFDYIVLSRNINILMPYDKGIKDKYRLIGDFKMEDNSQIFVYKSK
ncbi:MAG: glycosyltransferase family 39 protein [Elusimicrobia bacterium]|nr:glycosyltransferase family 39 protein [Candidatus Liberimonas magnetica]